jgi:hypothetical protein
MMSLEHNHLIWSNQTREVLGLLPSPTNKNELLYRLGLAMQTQRESNARKVLACDEEAFPVDAGDGILLGDALRTFSQSAIGRYSSSVNACPSLASKRYRI